MSLMELTLPARQDKHFFCRFLSGLPARCNEMVREPFLSPRKACQMIHSLRHILRRVGKSFRPTSSPLGTKRLLPTVEALEERVVPTYTPAGNPVDVSKMLLGGQNESSSRTVAEMSNGNYRVVWEDHGVWTRLFSSAGAPLTNPVQVDSNPDDAQATVAIDDNGQYMIAWTDGTSVSAEGFTSQGVLKTHRQMIDGGGYGFMDDPSVAMDSADDYVLAVADHNSMFNSGIFMVQGNVTGGATKGSTVAAGNQVFTDPSVAMTAGGSFVVAWAQGPSLDQQAIYAQRFTAAGTAQGTQIAVKAVLGVSQPSVAVDAQGDFVIAYTRIVGEFPVADGLINTTNYQTEVEAAFFNASGVAQRLLRVFGSANPTESAYAPSAAMDGNGNFVIGFTEGGSYGAYLPQDGFPRAVANAYSSKGTLKQGGINLAAGMPAPGSFNNDFAPSVALSATGHLVTDWENFGTKVDNNGLATTGVFTQAFKGAVMQAAPHTGGTINGLPPTLTGLAGPAGTSPTQSVLTFDEFAILIGLLRPASDPTWPGALTDGGGTLTAGTGMSGGNGLSTAIIAILVGHPHTAPSDAG
jgi:hypothetical protein